MAAVRRVPELEPQSQPLNGCSNMAIEILKAFYIPSTSSPALEQETCRRRPAHQDTQYRMILVGHGAKNLSPNLDWVLARAAFPGLLQLGLNSRSVDRCGTQTDWHVWWSWIFTGQPPQCGYVILRRDPGPESFGGVGPSYMEGSGVSNLGFEGPRAVNGASGLYMFFHLLFSMWISRTG